MASASSVKRSGDSGTSRAFETIAHGDAHDLDSAACSERDLVGVLVEQTDHR